MNASSPRIRRVLTTADTVGGVWTFAMDLARGLCRRDIEVGLATMGPLMSGAQRQEASVIVGLKIFESDYRLEWMPDPWNDIQAAGDWLLELELGFKPNIVHLNSYVHGSLPWQTPRLITGHSCVLSWWRAVKGCEAPAMEWSRYREAVTSGLRAADVVTAPSRSMMTDLQRYYGPLAGYSAVIANGSTFPVASGVAKEPLVLAAGRLWDEGKNLTTLDALGALIEWPISVAGDPRHPDGGTSDLSNLTLLGQLSRPDLGQWYARAGIYCFPARYEPFGLSVLEAALSGCALVLGDIPSLRENWTGCAVFADPGNVHELADRVSSLIHDGARRSALAAKARAHALTMAPERMSEQYATLYRQMLTSPAVFRGLAS